MEYQGHSQEAFVHIIYDSHFPFRLCTGGSISGYISGFRLDEPKATNGNFLEYLDILTGGALSQATIFSLSITPYINASIIMQLLTYALPPLERLRDEEKKVRKS